jgi:hypothetical protein
MIVVGGNKLDGLWFETWSRPSIQGVLDYCISMVWKDGSSGGLVENPIKIVCCVVDFQPCEWTFNELSWRVMMGASQVLSHR